MPSVVEYTMVAKPDQYDALLDAYIDFADRFGDENPTEDLILITGDRESGIVRGIGVFGSQGEGDVVYGAETFIAFRDFAAHLIDDAPSRTERDLVHVYVKG